VVVEIVSPSTAAKYRLESAPVIWKAAIISTVDTSPDNRFIAEKDQPGETLGAVARDGADGVDRHHRADQVEEHVETPEVPA